MRYSSMFLCNILAWFRIISRPTFSVVLVDDHPEAETMSDRFIYIVGGRDFAKWAYFRCPADRDEIVQLSLMPKRRPHWSVTIDFLGRPTLSPSVRQLEGSYAHFWIKKGAVVWCADSGRMTGKHLH